MHLFTRAYSTAPWTYPSTNSILSGLYPSHHGAVQAGLYKLNVSNPWPQKINQNTKNIFHILKDQGYRSLGISTIFWALNGQNHYGLDKILRSEKQDVFYTNTPASWVIDNFIKWKNEIGNDPYVSYLHFTDLHRPYDINVSKKFSKEKFVEFSNIENWGDQKIHEDDIYRNEFRLSKIKAYEGLINYVDTELDRLFSFLKKNGTFDDTVIFLTADHGEEFWDHFEYEKQNIDCGKKSSSEPWLLGTGHGHTFFNELINVPFILLNSPNEPVIQEDSLISNIDILPSILDIAGISFNSGDFDGQSIFRQIDSRKVLSESILYGFEKKALITNKYKIHYAPFENGLTIFDLSDHIENLTIAKNDLLQNEIDHLINRFNLTEISN